MKRILLTLSAVIALSSCIQDELLESQSPSEVVGAVAFESYLGRDAMTRASVEDAATLNTKGFGVMAWYTGQDSYSEGYTSDDYDYDFMVNTKVSNEDGTGWSYSPLKYWPNNEGDKLTFLAYAPYNAAYSAVADGTSTALSQTIDFTVENEVKDQTDLLWSDNPENENMIKPAVDSKVLFTFKHALSRIGFKVAAFVDDVRTDEDSKSENLDASTVINVKKVMLVSGSTVYNTDNTVIPEGVFYTGGTLDLYNFTPADATEIVPAAWDEKLQENGGQYFELTADSHFVNTTTDDADETVFQLSGDEATTLQTLNADDSYIMIIPQNFTDEFTDGYKVYIEYDVVTTGDNALGESDGSTITNRILSEEALTTNFLSGKAYTLNIWLGMTSVKFEVEVAEWVDGNPSDTDEYLPENTQKAIMGLGTETNPYEIWNYSNLSEMRDNINSNADAPEGGVAWNSAYYRQMADITMPATVTKATAASWVPINTFSGQYDGQDYDIINLTINNTESSSGTALIFENNGEIRNVDIVDCKINGYISAALVYRNNGTLTGCTASGTVMCKSTGAGLCYSNNGTIISSSSNVNVTSEGDISGGLVAYNNNGAIIEYCSNSGLVYSTCTTDNNGHCGGIASDNEGKIIASYNSGTVKSDTGNSSYSDALGGIAGRNNSEIIGCYNIGQILPNRAYVGGISGYIVSAGTKFTACFNAVELSGSLVGGIFGRTDYDGHTFTANFYTGASQAYNSVSASIAQDQKTAWLNDMQSVSSSLTWEAATAQMNDALANAGIKYVYVQKNGPENPPVIEPGTPPQLTNAEGFAGGGHS